MFRVLVDSPDWTNSDAVLSWFWFDFGTSPHGLSASLPEVFMKYSNLSVCYLWRTTF